ncbi:MAG: hypothetical protein IV100_14740, partial [Myxococcales bacterium]|nr:hypothetical protein [Myxococcales bacterium]
MLRGGVDLPSLSDTETFAVGLDLGVENSQSQALDDVFDFLVGVPAEASQSGVAYGNGCVAPFALPSCAGIYRATTAGDLLARRFTALAAETLSLSASAFAVPSAAQPDIEYIVDGFGALRAAFLGGVQIEAANGWRMRVGAVAGSFQDDGIGEDFFPNTGSSVEVLFPPPELAFTGNTTADLPLTDAAVREIVDAANDVTLPPGPITTSGWDIENIRLKYVLATDQLLIGIACSGICGDADDDGDPSGTSAALTGAGGIDGADLGGSETTQVLLDLGIAGGGAALDGVPDFVVGVPGAAAASGLSYPAPCNNTLLDISCAGVYRAVVGATAFETFTVLAGETLPLVSTVGASPSAASPDFQIAVDRFSELWAGFTGVAFDAESPLNVGVSAFLGADEDDGIGEDDVSATVVALPCPLPGCSVLALTTALSPIALIEGETASIDVALSVQPTSTVVIAVQSPAVAVLAASLSVSSLTFTPVTWNTPQTVVLSTVDNADIDGDVAADVTFSVSSSDTRFQGKSETVPATKFDNDVVSSFRFSITLTDSTVVELAVTGSVNADDADLVDVLRVDEAFVNGADALPLDFLEVASGGGVPFLSLSGASANFRACELVDCSTAGRVIEITTTTKRRRAASIDVSLNGAGPVAAVSVIAGGVTVGALSAPIVEGGSPQTIAFSLATAPTSDVTLTFVSSITALGVTTSLTFTTGDSSTPQNLVLTPNDDDVDRDATAVEITITVTSSDPSYSGVAVGPLSLIVIDNDDAGLNINLGDGLTTTEAGGTDTFTVVLNSEPTATITVSLTSSNVNEATVTSTLTFTTSNWNAPQTATVTGVNDDVDDGDASLTITLTATGDTQYDATAASTVSATNADNDVAGVTVDVGDGLTTTEAGGSDTFTIVLDSEPTEDVFFELRSDDETEVRVSPRDLVFTSATWDVPQTVTVSGFDDSADDGSQTAPIVILVSTANPANQYNDFSVPSLSVVNADDDDVTTEGQCCRGPADCGSSGVDECGEDEFFVPSSSCDGSLCCQSASVLSSFVCPTSSNSIKLVVYTASNVVPITVCLNGWRADDATVQPASATRTITVSSSDGSVSKGPIAYDCDLSGFPGRVFCTSGDDHIEATDCQRFCLTDEGVCVTRKRTAHAKRATLDSSLVGSSAVFALASGGRGDPHLVGPEGVKFTFG